MPDFYTLTTTIGNNLVANALATKTEVALTEIALGDGNGSAVNPDPTQQALINEVYRGSVSSIEVDPDNPNYLVIEMIVPTNVGGWTVREFGVYTDEGYLFAVGNFPETYKPIIAEGSGRDLRIRVIVEVSSTSVVTLKIDPAIVVASQDWVAKNYSISATLPGGETGQVLTKASEADGDVKWNTLKIENAIEYHKIGTPIELQTTVLPSDCMWPDRSLALFEDWPRFYQKYLNGGFEGMILPANSDATTIANNPGKFVLSLDSEGNPNGLYLQDIQNLFPRYGTTSNVGTRNNAGSPNITGSVGMDAVTRNPVGLVSRHSHGANTGTHSGGTQQPHATIYFDASNSNPIYGLSDTVMPESVNIIVAIYLG